MLIILTLYLYIMTSVDDTNVDTHSETNNNEIVVKDYLALSNEIDILLKVTLDNVRN